MIRATNEVTLVKVDDGAKGDTGTGVSSMTTEFYLSTSKATQTGGSWLTEMPTWSSGMYLWTRTKIIYSNPDSIEYTTPVCDSSWEAANEAAKTATNYMNFDDNGLVVGNMTEEVLGKNVLIDLDSVDIRDGNTTLASFGANEVDLGKNEETTVIKMCGGLGTIKAAKRDIETSTYNDSLSIDAESVLIPTDFTNRSIYNPSNGLDQDGNELIDSDHYISSIIGTDSNVNIGSLLLQAKKNIVGKSKAEIFVATTPQAGAQGDESYVYLCAEHTPDGGSKTSTSFRINSKSASLTGHLFVNGTEFTGDNKVLWTGALLMNASNTITLSEAISAQANGIVLVWGFYQDGEVRNGNYNSYFVPKFMIEQYSGTGHIMFMTTATGNYASNKALYIKDTEINGISYNDRASVTTNASIKVSPQNFALCRVIGV